MGVMIDPKILAECITEEQALYDGRLNRALDREERTRGSTNLAWFFAGLGLGVAGVLGVGTWLNYKEGHPPKFE